MVEPLLGIYIRLSCFQYNKLIIMQSKILKLFLTLVLVSVFFSATEVDARSKVFA